MKKCVNGKIIELTSEEIAALEREMRLEAIAENSRPMTADEVTLLMIAHQINNLVVDDNTALRMVEFYPEWAENSTYEVGYKVRQNDKLWRCIQAHTSLVGWEPANNAALWEQINEAHSGEIDDPIPYEGNMALSVGMHYIQDGVIYRCNRNTLNPVYNPLAELVGLYVEVV